MNQANVFLSKIEKSRNAFKKLVKVKNIKMIIMKKKHDEEHKIVTDVDYNNSTNKIMRNDEHKK